MCDNAKIVFEHTWTRTWTCILWTQIFISSTPYHSKLSDSVVFICHYHSIYLFILSFLFLFLPRQLSHSFFNSNLYNMFVYSASSINIVPVYNVYIIYVYSKIPPIWTTIWTSHALERKTKNICWINCFPSIPMTLWMCSMNMVRYNESEFRVILFLFFCFKLIEKRSKD